MSALDNVAINTAEATSVGKSDDVVKLKRMIKSQASEMDRLRSANVQEAKDLVDFRAALEARERRMVQQVHEIGSSLRALEVKAKNLAEKEADLEKRLLGVQLSERCLAEQGDAVSQREVASILRVENAYQSHQTNLDARLLLAKEAEQRVHIAREDLLSREKVFTAHMSAMCERVTGQLSECKFREESVRTDGIRAQHMLDATKSELVERSRALERKLSEVVGAQERLRSDELLLKEREVTFESRKHSALNRLTALMNHLLQAGLDSTPNVDGTQSPSQQFNDRVVISANDGESARQQLECLHTFATQRGLPLERLEGLRTELGALLLLTPHHGGSSGAPMDNWWRELAVCSQAMTQ
jgi:hypothetical protein